jgi:hypothetical protein
MATARPFAYNTGSPIDGTIQVGDLAVGTPTSGITNNPTFWNGPDEDLGYVIAVPVSGNTQPTPILGVFASLGFYGTEIMTNPFSESSFVELTNTSFNQNFTSGNDASIWLTNNGYWNSWVPSTPTPTPTQNPTPTPSITATQTSTPTNTVTPTTTPTPTPTPGGGWFFYISNGGTITRAPNNNGETVFNVSGKSVYNPNYTGGTLSLNFNNINTAGTSYASQFTTLNNSGGTITISQGSSTAIYSGTSTDYVGTATLIRLDVSRSAQMIQSASTQFVSGTSINVVVS